MSMNLGCSHFKVRQTPTFITKMILSIDNYGESDGGISGVVSRYIQWCGHECQQQVAASTSEEDKNAITEEWSDHIAAFVLSVSKAGDDVKFYEE